MSVEVKSHFFCRWRRFLDVQGYRQRNALDCAQHIGFAFGSIP